MVPVMTDCTSCITTSLDAKHHGVKTGTPLGEARQMCPGIVVVEARSELYVYYHHRLVALIEHCVSVSKVLSIDEVRCDLPDDADIKNADSSSSPHTSNKRPRRQAGAL